MRIRLLSWLLASIIILFVAAPAQSVYQDGPAFWDTDFLAAVEFLNEEGVDLFESLDLPLFARLHGLDGDIFITAVNPENTAAVEAGGTALQILDSFISGPYYLAYAIPGRVEPQWNDYGRLLLVGTDWRLLQIQPAAAGRLAETGVELQALTLTPKPLRPVSSAPNYTETIDPDPTIQAMMDQVISDTVTLYDGGLSGEFPVDIGGENYTIATRYTYSGVPIQKATQYVGQHLDNLGMPVEYHQWSGSTYPNVIGEIAGQTNPEEIYLITAHLDDMPSGSLAPGADDNASGVTAVLIAADIFSQYQWDCTIRFALFTGEEQGLNGSEAYAMRSYYAGEDIQGVLNLDMIGWNTPASSPDIDLHANAGVPGSVPLAQLFADVVSAYNLNLIPQVITNGTGASDHASFWIYNYPAILGIEDYYGTNDFNPYYHTTQDLLEHLDIGYFTEFVKASIGTFAHMTGCLVDGESGLLEGHVTNADNAVPIAGAMVEMVGDNSTNATTTTNVSGYYSQTLPVGTYTLTVSAANFLPATITGVAVISGTITTQDVALQPVPADIYYTYIPAIHKE